VSASRSSHLDILVGGLGWLAVASQGASGACQVSVHVSTAASQVQVELRPLMFDPYATWLEVMGLQV
jgi:hypothetical protein